MSELPVLVDVDPGNLDTLRCCGVNNPAHEGRRQKLCWMRANFARGVRAKVLTGPGNRQFGYIEYLPGEYAWRGVDAAGYLFIHCIWTYSRQYQHQGLGALMLDGCVKDAAASGCHGVAVVARDRPWMAGSSLFLKNGFEVVETAPPDYQLLVRKLDPAARNPSFRGDWDRKLKRYSRGLTIIHSRQCPHTAKFVREIAQAAEEDYGIKPRLVELKSCREAQNAPTPYAVFAIIHNGRLLADHQVSLTRFRNIMRKLAPTAG